MKVRMKKKEQKSMEKKREAVCECHSQTVRIEDWGCDSPCSQLCDLN